MVYYIVRGLFVLLFTFTAWQLGQMIAGTSGGPAAPHALAGIVMGGIVAALLVTFESYFTQKYIAVFYSIVAGVFVGLLLSVFFVQIISYLPPIAFPPESRQLIGILVTLFCCYLSTVLVLKARGNYRILIPFIELKPEGPQRKHLVLDTSAIVDGRFVEVCNTTLIDTPIYVPDFVLQEVHGLADSSDTLRRSRGRRGLDMLHRMQTNPRLRVEILKTRAFDGEVDARLIDLAREINGRVVTSDFNLHKVAQLQGLDVININELSQALRLNIIPGDELTVRVVRQGEEADQGVGYLEDGTMVVVEQGRNLIGREAITEVTSVLQRAAGRMVFARPRQDPPDRRRTREPDRVDKSDRREKTEKGESRDAREDSTDNNNATSNGDAEKTATSGEHSKRSGRQSRRDRKSQPRE